MASVGHVSHVQPQSPYPLRVSALTGRSMSSSDPDAPHHLITKSSPWIHNPQRRPTPSQNPKKSESHAPSAKPKSDRLSQQRHVSPTEAKAPRLPSRGGSSAQSPIHSGSLVTDSRAVHSSTAHDQFAGLGTAARGPHASTSHAAVTAPRSSKSQTSAVTAPRSSTSHGAVTAPRSSKSQSSAVTAPHTSAIRGAADGGILVPSVVGAPFPISGPSVNLAANPGSLCRVGDVVKPQQQQQQQQSFESYIHIHLPLHVHHSSTSPPLSSPVAPKSDQATDFIARCPPHPFSSGSVHAMPPVVLSSVPPATTAVPRAPSLHMTNTAAAALVSTEPVSFTSLSPAPLSCQTPINVAPSSISTLTTTPSYYASTETPSLYTTSPPRTPAAASAVPLAAASPPLSQTFSPPSNWPQSNSPNRRTLPSAAALLAAARSGGREPFRAALVSPLLDGGRRRSPPAQRRDLNSSAFRAVAAPSPADVPNWPSAVPTRQSEILGPMVAAIASDVSPTSSIPDPFRSLRNIFSTNCFYPCPTWLTPPRRSAAAEAAAAAQSSSCDVSATIPPHLPQSHSSYSVFPPTASTSHNEVVMTSAPSSLPLTYEPIMVQQQLPRLQSNSTFPALPPPRLDAPAQQMLSPQLHCAAAPREPTEMPAANAGGQQLSSVLTSSVRLQVAPQNAAAYPGPYQSVQQQQPWQLESLFEFPSGNFVVADRGVVVAERHGPSTAVVTNDSLPPYAQANSGRTPTAARPPLPNANSGVVSPPYADNVRNSSRLTSAVIADKSDNAASAYPPIALHFFSLAGHEFPDWREEMLRKRVAQMRREVRKGGRSSVNSAAGLSASKPFGSSPSKPFGSSPSKPFDSSPSKPFMSPGRLHRPPRVVDTPAFPVLDTRSFNDDSNSSHGFLNDSSPSVSTAAPMLSLEALRSFADSTAPHKNAINTTRATPVLPTTSSTPHSSAAESEELTSRRHAKVSHKTADRTIGSQKSVKHGKRGSRKLPPLEHQARRISSASRSAASMKKSTSTSRSIFQILTFGDLNH